MSKGYSKAVNRLRTGNTMATKGQKDETTVCVVARIRTNYRNTIEMKYKIL
jgi:hypothetical protein